MKYSIARLSVYLGLFLAVTACKKENKSGASPLSPADLNAIPVVAADDDGMGDVTRPDTSTITTCGNTQATVAARIADCKFSWNGEALGKMGEGKW